MKQTKKWLAVLLSALLALGLLPTAVLAEEDGGAAPPAAYTEEADSSPQAADSGAQAEEDPTPEAFPDHFAGLSQGETRWYYLTKNVTQDITVNGATLVLFLEGYTLTGSVTVNSGKLDLRGYHGNETAEDKTGKVTGTVTVNGGEFVLNSGGLGGGVTMNGGRFEMNGGSITGYTEGDSNGVRSGVTVNGGSAFTMIGGDIDGSNSSSVSGVIVNAGGTFTMTSDDRHDGGNITGCVIPESTNEAYKYGAGVTVNGGVFTMNTGSILNNKGVNAGVNVFWGGTFTMTGGVIDRNDGIGLTVSTNNSTATISGDRAFITNSTGFGAHVIDTGRLTLASGTIGPNERTGVFVADGGSFTMSSGYIQNNKNSGVRVEGSAEEKATFTMTGGEIRGNSAVPADDLVYAGGGVYVGENGVFQVSGSPQVAGNSSASDPSYFDNVRGMIKVAAPLTSGAGIFLNYGYQLVGDMVKTVVLGGGPYGELGYFISDDENCVIVKSADGNDLVLKVKDSGEEEPVPGGYITRAQLAEKIHGHTPFGLSGRTSNSASVFTDVGHLTLEQRTAIGVLYDEKIMGGVGDGKFNPNAADVTRAQAAVIVWRASGSRSNTSPANIPYLDIPEMGAWYSAAINCLYAMGVLDNTDMDGDGNFNPDVPVTAGTVDKWLAAYTGSFSSGVVEQETVAGGSTRAGFVLQYYEYFRNVISDSRRVTTEQAPFLDIDDCTEEEKEAITYWYQMDVIRGRTDGNFGPYSAPSNMDIAVFISNVNDLCQSDAAQQADEIAAYSVMPLDGEERTPWYEAIVDDLISKRLLSADAGKTITGNPYAPVLTVNMKEWGANTGLAAAAPVFSPESGTVFSSSLSVTIKTDTKDAKIYYTTDGSIPTERSTLYEGPFILRSSATVRAIAVNANGAVSDAAAATYTRRVPAPPVDNGSTGGSYYPGSSGGNSGDTGSSTTPAPEPTPAVTTTTTTNPDGSTTTTTTDKATGAVTETTTYPNGAVKVVETTGNGTVTTKETAANGVQVTTVRAPGTAVTASVTIPEGIDAVTVTIAAAVTPGTVAVDTRTGQVIKLSIPTAGGLAVKLDHSANFVLADRSKNFSDTANHWAKDSVTFVAARELFQGTSTSEPTFEPELPMTRAMLMTVLARLDSAEADSGSIGYGQGMAWAVANGVSDGSDPDGQITREQLATMLWRYAGFPASSYVLDQPDAGSISDYARAAMAWAVEVGILNGYDDGSLRPDATATRAVVATMIQRFCTTLV